MSERQSAKPEGMPQEMWDKSFAGAAERFAWARSDAGDALLAVLWDIRPLAWYLRKLGLTPPT